MTTKTYWSHIDHETGQPAGPRAKFWGMAQYGYKTLARAKLHCPLGACVQERHSDGGDDWAGRIIWCRP